MNVKNAKTDTETVKFHTEIVNLNSFKPKKNGKNLFVYILFCVHCSQMSKLAAMNQFNVLEIQKTVNNKKIGK